jgi:N-acetylglutamate synthase
MIQVEPFLPDDYDAVMELWRSCDGIVLRPVDERQPLLSYLSRNPGLSFVAREDGEVVAAVLAGTDGRRGYLQHLGVAATHRRRGIGRRLVSEVIRELQRQGIYKCHLFVVEGNVEATHFWQSLGWQPRSDLLMFSFGAG